MSNFPEKYQHHIQSKIPERRLSTKKLAGEFIQDLGRHLKLSKQCIYSALVYMYKFFDFHGFEETLSNNFTKNKILAIFAIVAIFAYHWYITCTYAKTQHYEIHHIRDFIKLGVCTAALFLAAKYEDERRPLEHVIKVSHMYSYKGAPLLDVNSKVYNDKRDQVLILENMLLQTLGFNLEVKPHVLSEAMEQSAENENSSNGNLSRHGGIKRKLTLEEYRNSRKANVGTSTVLPLSENVNTLPCVPTGENSPLKPSMNGKYSKENSVDHPSTVSSVKWRLIPLTLSPQKKLHNMHSLSIEDYQKRK